MAIQRLLLLSTLLFLSVFTPAQSTSTSFIASSCRAARYHSLCVRSLSPYARAIGHDAHTLARVALIVSFSNARSAVSHATKLSRANGIARHEYAAVRDCIYTLSNAVNGLSKSIHELGQMKQRVAGPDFEWHVSNVETWVSAALTDDNTCLAGFGGTGGGQVKAAMRKRVNYVARITSNALALVDRLATIVRGQTTNS